MTNEITVDIGELAGQFKSGRQFSIYHIEATRRSPASGRDIVLTFIDNEVIKPSPLYSLVLSKDQSAMAFSAPNGGRDDVRKSAFRKFLEHVL